MKWRNFFINDCSIWSICSDAFTGGFKDIIFYCVIIKTTKLTIIIIHVRCDSTIQCNVWYNYYRLICIHNK